MIFAIGAEQAARALVDAKSPIPVVIIANDYDPVKAGIVASLRRPGGNVTGVVVTQIELSAKRLEIMREILPAATHYLVLSDVFTKDQLDATRQAARKLRVEIVAETFGAPPYDIEAALTKSRTPRVDALINGLRESDFHRPIAAAVSSGSCIVPGGLDPNSGNQLPNQLAYWQKTTIGAPVNSETYAGMSAVAGVGLVTAPTLAGITVALGCP